jgi:acetyl esterase
MLHPVAQSIVDASKKPDARPNAHLNPVPVARANFEGDFAGLKKPEGVETKELEVPTRDGAKIRGRLYRPMKSDEENEVKLPCIIWLHGGGWILGSIDSSDVTTRLLCLATGCAVLSVDYRRAPESKFPTAVHDAVDSITWTFENAEKLGVDKDRLAVAGDSAGGNLATCACIALRDSGPKIAVQILVYPVTMCDLSVGYDEKWEGVILFKDELQWHQDNYLSSPKDSTNPLVSPLLLADLKGLPRAIAVIAECDPIRPQSELYVQALVNAGVQVDAFEAKTLPRGFFGLDELFPGAREGMDFVAEKVKAIFQSN